MRFAKPLVEGRLVSRYKRFFADALLDDGTLVTAHCANSGAMLGLTAPGNRVWLLPKDGGSLRYSLEIVEAEFGRGPEAVGVNTMHPNRLAEEAIRANFIPELTGYASLRREVRYGRNSRIDLLLESDGRQPCFVEVKNVHMMRRPGLAEFPDSVTARGTKHLGEMAAEVVNGARAVMLFVIQMQADGFSLAGDIDPAYLAAFIAARAAGVEALAVCCTVTPQQIAVERLVPVLV